MKERPILFSGPMVRAILEGRKTQTRRVVKCRGQWTCDNPDGRTWPHYEDECGEWISLECPHGTVGDLLLVRESFREVMDQTGGYAYLADCPLGNEKIYKWKPSIHMPRSASRLTLEITGVRVERLQEISKEDADAECFGGDYPENVLPHLFPRRDGGWGHLSIPECFAMLWQSINGPESWAANPWVWVIAFRRIQQ